MNVVSWSPFRDFEDLFNRYSRVPLRAGIASAGNDSSQEWRPVANISETSDAYVIKAELPEVSKEDVEVTVNEGVITIRGERRQQTVAEDEQRHRVESVYGAFARSFSLPPDVDEDAISAESRDGVLTVRLPKAEVAQPKAIEISVN